jgi:hypothetical protein
MSLKRIDLMIENPKYKSAFLTILFYAIFWILTMIRYKIFSSGTTMFFETIAPVALPAVTFVLLIKNMWQYFFYRAKENIFSIVIHGAIFLMYIFLIIRYLG